MAAPHRHHVDEMKLRSRCLCLFFFASTFLSAQAEIFLYDPSGHLTTAISPRGTKSQYLYDHAGSMVASRAIRPSVFRAGKSYVLTISAKPGQTVTGNLGVLGGSSTAIFHDDGMNGDSVAGDGIYSTSGIIASGVAPGDQLIEVTLTNGLGEIQTDYVTISIVVPGAPGWWSQTNIQIIGGQESNYSPVNLGQLKNMAKKAKFYLDAILPANAKKAAVEAKLAQFAPGNGIFYTTEEKTANYAIANVGQLKAIAKPFYEWLQSAGYDTRGNLIAHGFPAAPAASFPAISSSSDNYAPANIGQLKMIFSFEVKE